MIFRRALLWPGGDSRAEKGGRGMIFLFILIDNRSYYCYLISDKRSVFLRSEHAQDKDDKPAPDHS